MLNKYKNMICFKTFLENEETKDLSATISKLPIGHQELLNNFKIKITPNNTLKNDKEHVGYVYKNKIVIASPWHYSKSFTTLHEIAHLVYYHKMNKKIREEWKNLLKRTIDSQKNKLPPKCHKALNQSPEEIFCMAYASTYAKHPPITFHNYDWISFIKTKLLD